MEVLAPAIEELTPILDASKAVGFKAILCCKSSVNLDWMNFLLVEKLNDNSLLRIHGKHKMLNVHAHRRKIDTVDSQICDCGPPQRLIDPPGPYGFHIVNFRIS
jgi:hypothetical protein